MIIEKHHVHFKNLIPKHICKTLEKHKTVLNSKKNMLSAFQHLYCKHSKQAKMA